MEELRYYTCDVRLFNSKNYTTTIKLSDQTFKLDFRYNSFSESYFLNVYDSSGYTIASNKEVAPDRVFVFQPTSGVSLQFKFFKLLDSYDVNYENWIDNMACVAFYSKWVNVEA